MTFASLTHAGFSTCLTKHIEDRHLEGSFAQLYEYMIDAEPDGFNKGYGDDEQTLLHSLRNAYEQNSKSGQLNLCYLSSPDNQVHAVNLTDIVKQQPDIFHEKEELFGDASGSYREIQLVCEHYEAGG
jgi:hypothetical protein